MLALDLRSSVLEDAIFYQAVCRLVNLEDSYPAPSACLLPRILPAALSRAADCTEIDLTSARLSQCSLMDAILTRGRDDAGTV